ncbi:MAG: phosphoribosylformylglycinamidine synthase subunit PurS [Actinomycetia bacterium]|nr:phosphoribosylformylglycinamidine synthase subunit PurS [Actinomycetes bacterium]
MKHTFSVTIERRSGLSDPEGATASRALTDLGFAGVHSVSFGKVISIELEADTAQEAATQVEAMCRKLLANPVIENYTIENVS